MSTAALKSVSEFDPEKGAFYLTEDFQVFLQTANQTKYVLKTCMNLMSSHHGSHYY